MKKIFSFIIGILTTVVIIHCKNDERDFSFFNELFNVDVSGSIQESAHKEHERRLALTHVMNLKGQMNRKFFSVAAQATNFASMVCSPFVALLPLGKLVFGAEGDAKEQVLSAIGLKKEDDVAPFYLHLLNEIQNLENITLEVGSRMYISHLKKLKSKFKQNIEDVFHSSLDPIDMKKPNLIAASVNYWVEDQTHGIVKNLLSPSSIPRNISLMIINAVHFKGIWLKPFEKVTSETFYGLRGRRLEDMMYAAGTYETGYSPPLDSVVVRIPYHSSDVSLYLFLPNQKDGLPALIFALKDNPDLVNRVLMVDQYVQLFLPKMYLQSKLDLIPLYYGAGYNPYTELTNIAEGESVFISQATQMASIDVSENSNLVPTDSVDVIPGHKLVKANRPFLFFVIAKYKLLFSGIFS